MRPVNRLEEDDREIEVEGAKSNQRNRRRILIAASIYIPATFINHQRYWEGIKRYVGNTEINKRYGTN